MGKANGLGFIGCLFALLVLGSFIVAYMHFPFWLFCVFTVPVFLSPLHQYIGLKCGNGSVPAFIFIVVWLVAYVTCHIIYW